MKKFKKLFFSLLISFCFLQLFIFAFIPSLYLLITLLFKVDIQIHFLERRGLHFQFEGISVKEKDALLFYAEKLSLKIGFSPFKKQLSLDLDLHDFSAEVDKIYVTFQRLIHFLLKEPSKLSSWLHIDLSLEAKKGLLHFENSEEKAPLEVSYVSKDKRTKCHISIGDKKVDIHAVGHASRGISQITLNQCSLEMAASFFNLIKPSKGSLKIPSSVCNGTIYYVKELNEEVHTKDLEVCMDKKLSFKGSLKRLRGDIWIPKEVELALGNAILTLKSRQEGVDFKKDALFRSIIELKVPRWENKAAGNSYLNSFINPFEVCFNLEKSSDNHYYVHSAEIEGKDLWISEGTCHIRQGIDFVSLPFTFNCREVHLRGHLELGSDQIVLHISPFFCKSQWLEKTKLFKDIFEKDFSGAVEFTKPLSFTYSLKEGIIVSSIEGDFKNLSWKQLRIKEGHFSLGKNHELILSKVHGDLLLNNTPLSFYIEKSAYAANKIALDSKWMVEDQEIANVSFIALKEDENPFKLQIDKSSHLFKGKIQSEGDTIHIHINKNALQNFTQAVDITLKGSLDKCQCKIEDQDQSFLSFLLEKKTDFYLLKNIEGSFKKDITFNAESGEINQEMFSLNHAHFHKDALGYLDVKRVTYEIKSHRGVLNDGHFDFKKEGIAILLKENKGEKILPFLDKIEEKQFSGIFSGRIDASVVTGSMHLQKGFYKLCDKEIYFNLVELIKSPSKTLLNFEWMQELEPLALSVHLFDSQNKGQAFLSSKIGENAIQADISYINEQFKIHNVQGIFKGLHIDVKEGGNNTLEGLVALNLDDIAPYTGPSIKKRLNERIFGPCFVLNGVFYPEGFLHNAPLFKGKLTSENCIIKKCELDLFESDVVIEKQHISFANTKISDKAALLTAEKMEIDEKAILTIPLLHIQDLSLSLLKKKDQPRPKGKKPFMIQEALVQNIQGNLDDPDTFTGVGYFHFYNRKKKVPINPVLKVPAEIVSRIGLNPAVLSPSKGLVYFDITNGKYVLTDFKDVRSEGKLSKFSLIDHSQENFIDFEGNLHLMIKMKQYNLLFKLAELFTICVEGDTDKPKYTFNRVDKKT
jgi:hypothetical protein